MKENEIGTRKTGTDIYAALGRYRKLLDHYNIEQKIQEVVLNSVLKSLETDPQGTIREIDGYWEETFDSDGRNKETPPQTKPDLQRALYELRREQWKKYRRNKR